MIEAEARTLLLKQSHDDGCTCQEGWPQVYFRESGSKRIVLIGHEDDCSRTRARDPITLRMRVLMMRVSHELEDDVWEEGDVEEVEG